MIASPLSRRVVIGGVVSAAAFSGCSFPGTSSTKTDTADHDRLLKARDLSQRMLGDLEATSAQGHQMATVLLTARSLHTTQIAQFARSGKSSPAPTSSATPLTPKTLRTQEQALVRELQALALQADRGDVAALLASAAAGIEQILVGMR